MQTTLDTWMVLENSRNAAWVVIAGVPVRRSVRRINGAPRSILRTRDGKAWVLAPCEEPPAGVEALHAVWIAGRELDVYADKGHTWPASAMRDEAAGKWFRIIRDHMHDRPPYTDDAIDIYDTL